VNAINSEMTKELGEVFRKLDKEDNVKGVILTGRPHGFSAGLDVMELATGGIDGVRKFWVNYLTALQAMIRFSKPFVCAITGYAPAGATIFTLCADYRIMGKGPKHVVGMHEFKMSMQIPKMLGDVYAWHLGERRAWEAVLDAKLFDSEQALEMGLVNESCEVEEVLERAEQKLKKYIKVYGSVFSKTKAYFRKGLLDIANNANIDELVEIVVEDSADPVAAEYVKQFLMSLKK
jgi:3,2-trans-enoyl-CoA isomerase